MLQTCENVIWHLPLNSTLFNSFCPNLLCFPFTYWNSVSKFCGLQIVIRVKVRSSELSDTGYRNAISYPHVIKLWVSQSGESVSMSEHSALNNKFLDVSQFCTIKIIINTFVQTPISNCLFENIVSLQFCIETSFQKFIQYLGKSLNTYPNFPYKLSLGHHFYYLVHACSEQLNRNCYFVALCVTSYQ
jgi:hypothetical protein